MSPADPLSTHFRVRPAFYSFRPTVRDPPRLYMRRMGQYAGLAPVLCLIRTTSGQLNFANRPHFSPPAPNQVNSPDSESSLDESFQEH
eukprot:1800143-Prymnesium_polylepis.1